MAFVGGLLIYVASNMVKGHEVKLVLKSGKLHIFLMSYTAIMTLVTDLAVAVVSATVLYYTLKILLRKHAPHIKFESFEHAMGVVPIIEKMTIDCPKCGHQIDGNGSGGDPLVPIHNSNTAGNPGDR